MENIKIEATSNTPKVDFNFAENRLALAGESFSEEVSNIYENILETTASYLNETAATEIEFVVELIYFNSLSARKIFQILTLLDEAAAEKHTITITWCYNSYDDNMLEFGEEYAEDIEHAAFVLKEIPED